MDLAAFRLKRLILTANRISVIPFSKQGSHTQNISHLGLSGNGIDTWADIDALHSHLPKLEALSITENPLTERNLDQIIFIAKVTDRR